MQNYLANSAHPDSVRPGVRNKVIAAAALFGMAALGSGSVCAGAEANALSAGSGPPAATAAPSRTSAVPFVEDDFERALREARASNRPLFVEAWAPW